MNWRSFKFHLNVLVYKLEHNYIVPLYLFIEIDSLYEETPKGLTGVISFVILWLVIIE